MGISKKIKKELADKVHEKKAKIMSDTLKDIRKTIDEVKELTKKKAVA